MQSIAADFLEDEGKDEDKEATFAMDEEAEVERPFDLIFVLGDKGEEDEEEEDL